MLWPDFLKKRLCRYLLQHYLGHFFKEKISLEQLSIDIYNGTGCVKNLNLDCEALNEQLNTAANTNMSGSTMGNSSGPSSIPVEIVSGFVGYISVYIPWHDLFNDYCKLTIKNVQIIIRTKQRRPHLNQPFKPFGRKFSNSDLLDDEGGGGGELGDEDDSDAFYDTNADSTMFSSMLYDSIMNTSMHIAQECMNESSEDEVDESRSSLPGAAAASSSNSLLGLEAFASTIDSILSRIKINLEQIHIRIENLDQTTTNVMYSGGNLNDLLYSSNVMNSSTLFNNKPSNGIALELRIKSFKYFDVDSATMSNANVTPNR
jgi:autophagy-related protein 2